jgi:hypothetical protein
MMPSKEVCKVRIIRHSGYADRLRSYRIIINGGEAGTIANNSVIEFAVPSGPLTIEARLDWGRSRPLNIEALPNENIEVEVSNHWGAFLGIWAITFGFRSYLTLKRQRSFAA